MFNSNKKFVSRYWLIVFFVLIGICILIFQVSFQEIGITLSALKLWQITILLLIFCLIAGVQVASRKYLLSTLHAACGFRNLIYIHFSTLAAHYSTPAKIGFPLAVYLLNKFENVPYSKGAAMILIELVISTGLCGIIALLYLPTLLKLPIQQSISGVLILLLSVMLVLFCIHVALKNISAENSVKSFFLNISSALKSIRVGQILIYMLFSLALRFLDGISLYFLSIFCAGTLTIWQAIVATSSAFFIGAVSMIPMGLGTRDVSLLLYLQHYNISDSTAIVIITLQRILSTGLSFLLGLVFGSILGIKHLTTEENIT
jgi:uncharacterized membrane protein YbhN (UPF0104 family)